MLPFLLLLVMSRKKLKVLLQVMGEDLRAWFLWSFVGFGLFYAPLCFAAAHAPGWIIAGDMASYYYIRIFISSMTVFIVSSIVYVLLIITKVLLAYVGSRVLNKLTAGYYQHLRKKR
ncbi:multidrug resistance efflux transporter family protein [Bacillus cereus]|uniref:Uncharacterized protein n=1 Tax=Bacillus cereus (strain VD014) TaxID=1053223 RepID=A0A9W5K1I9_BACC8|nr:hypothetical protein IIA_05879 [Bacillus cereus VD014]KAA0807510.1 hypothetical protein DN403_29215 [Bacillus sp. AY2-1]TKH63419.1 multidrug resistance efflux transporter family protein [Bacillus cereus]